MSDQMPSESLEPDYRLVADDLGAGRFVRLTDERLRQFAHDPYVCCTDETRSMARELEATRPRVIERTEDLDARPIGTVVRTDRGRIAEKTTDGLSSPCGRYRSGWMLTQTDEIECGTDELDDFPITVIWSPPCYRCGADHDNADELCVPCERVVMSEIGDQS